MMMDRDSLFKNMTETEEYEIRGMARSFERTRQRTQRAITKTLAHLIIEQEIYDTRCESLMRDIKKYLGEPPKIRLKYLYILQNSTPNESYMNGYVKGYKRCVENMSHDLSTGFNSEAKYILYKQNPFCFHTRDRLEDLKVLDLKTIAAVTSGSPSGNCRLKETWVAWILRRKEDYNGFWGSDLVNYPVDFTELLEDIS